MGYVGGVVLAAEVEEFAEKQEGRKAEHEPVADDCGEADEHVHYPAEPAEFDF